MKWQERRSSSVGDRTVHLYCAYQNNIIFYYYYCISALCVQWRGTREKEGMTWIQTHEVHGVHLCQLTGPIGII